MAEPDTISAPTALITGCSENGIGAALVEAFHARGVHVFATARNPAKMPYLEKLENVTPLQLDVSSSSSIAAAVETVKTKTGARLDYLVNNAGVPGFRPLLDVPMEETRAVFDVNFFAVLELTQALAPLIIAAKGSIVNISSIACRLNGPWLGIYSASKAALSSYSEVLRLEMEPFGVKVVNVMTGAVDSNITTNPPDCSLPEDSIYRSALGGIKAVVTREQVNVLTPAPDFARGLVNDVLGGASGEVWRGAYSSTARLLISWAPKWFLDYGKKAGSWLDHLP